MRADRVERLGGSLVQHGPLNDRVYLMHLERGDLPELPEELVDLARERGYSKVFAKVPSWAGSAFERSGFRTEACVPAMFAGRADGLFMGRYLDPDRAEPSESRTVEQVIDVATGMDTREPRPLPDGLTLAELGPEHAERMAEAYGAVFKSYPFPIQDACFLRQTLEDDVRAFAVLRGGRIAALAAAEMAVEAGNVEMTDFATLPDFRGLGLAGILLGHMEREMARAGMMTAYTISRGHAPGINIVFARAGYAHAGTLVNNTQIAGSLESMNVWYKPLGTGKGDVV